MYRDIYALALTPQDFANLRAIVRSLAEVKGKNAEMFSRIASGLSDSLRLDLEKTCETYPVTGEIVVVSSNAYADAFNK